MVEMFSGVIFISWEVPLAKIQPGLTSSISSNPSTRSYPFAWDWYSIRCSQGACSQELFVLSQAVRAPDMYSFYVYSGHISSPSYMTHFTSHCSQKSPLCLHGHVSLSDFAFGSLELSWGGCSEGCKWGMYVSTCRSVSTTCPKTGNLLPAFFAFLSSFFWFCLSQEACSLPKHRQSVTNLFLMFLLHLKEPELQMPISWWKKKGFLGLFHPAISKRK